MGPNGVLWKIEGFDDGSNPISFDGEVNCVNYMSKLGAMDKSLGIRARRCIVAVGHGLPFSSDRDMKNHHYSFGATEFRFDSPGP